MPLTLCPNCKEQPGLWPDACYSCGYNYRTGKMPQGLRRDDVRIEEIAAEPLAPPRLVPEPPKKKEEEQPPAKKPRKKKEKGPTPTPTRVPTGDGKSRPGGLAGHQVVITPALGRFGQPPIRHRWLEYDGDGSDDSIVAWAEQVRANWLETYQTWLTVEALTYLAISYEDNREHPEVARRLRHLGLPQ